jgi:hypothetical protein
MIINPACVNFKNETLKKLFFTDAHTHTGKKGRDDIFAEHEGRQSIKSGNQCNWSIVMELFSVANIFNPANMI